MSGTWTRRRVFLSLFKAAIVLGILAWLLSSGGLDFKEVVSALARPRWWWNVLPLAVLAIAIVSVRWSVLLRAEGIEIPLVTTVRLCLIGHFWNNVLPGSVTGDFVKMYYTGVRAPGRRTEAYTTIVLDRVVGLAALVAIAFVAALVNSSFILAHDQLRRTFYVMIACLAFFFLGGGALVAGVGRKSVLAETVRERVPFLAQVRRGYHTLLRFGARKGAVAVTLLLSILSHGTIVLIAYFSGRELDEKILSAAHYAFLVPIGLFANSVPLGTPGGAGVGEGVFSILFAWAGAGKVGAGIMLLVRVAHLALAAVGAILYVFDRHAREALRSPRVV